jgi:hypothetical protein
MAPDQMHGWRKPISYPPTVPQEGDKTKEEKERRERDWENKIKLTRLTREMVTCGVRGRSRCLTRQTALALRAHPFGRFSLTFGGLGKTRQRSEYDHAKVDCMERWCDSGGSAAWFSATSGQMVPTAVTAQSSARSSGLPTGARDRGGTVLTHQPGERSTINYRTILERWGRCGPGGWTD